MKKVLFTALVSMAIFSCNTNTTAPTMDSHEFGTNYDSTANMDLVKSTFKDMENFDSVGYITKYADTAIFEDNGNKMSLTDNVHILSKMAASGIKVKVDTTDYAMWSSHFNFKDGNQRDFVYTYISISFTKEDKTIKVKFFQADQFNKDGKIDREYLVYDQSQLATILN